jgi:pyruvate/2-oxoacid:ferredoxin oxidoreductase alpha subunit
VGEIEKEIYVKKSPNYRFVKKTLCSLSNEISLMSLSLYDHKEYKNVFELNERAWVGALNNTIIKTFPEKKIASLQEFAVYKKGKYEGRADLLISYNNEIFLFEAKRYYEQKENMFDDSASYLNKIRKQAERYLTAGKVFYEKKKVSIVSIAFGILKENTINEAKKYFKEYLKNDSSVDFCALYHQKNYGVWVYGKIYPYK